MKPLALLLVVLGLLGEAFGVFYVPKVILHLLITVM